jgi:hypothetical protein
MNMQSYQQKTEVINRKRLRNGLRKKPEISVVSSIQKAE